MSGVSLIVLACTTVQVISQGILHEKWAADPLSDCGGFTVDPSSLRIFDACGRQRQFRGVNKVAKTPPYYPSIKAFVPGNSLTPEDLVLWQSLGWNVVRLGVMMAGVMPARGFVNQSYLNIMANITADLYEHGVYTLVDFHQDLLSEAFCADGVPAWAAHDFARAALAFPLPVDQPYNISNSTGLPSGEDCGKHSWSEYYMADAVAAGFQYMYTNESALADLTTHWQAVVSSLQPLGPAVLFWELINEPWPGDMYQNPDLLLPGVADLQNLQPLYFKLADVIRATEADTPPYYQHIIMSESITFDDFFPVGFTEIPGGAQGASLSFHYYELPNFDADWQLDSRANDSRRLQALPMLTEFDIAIIDPWEPLSVQSVNHVLDLCEAGDIGYIGWEYADCWYPNGTLAYPTATVMSRPFPMAVAGRTVSYSFNTTTSEFGLIFVPNVSISAPSVVFVNHELHFTTGLQVSVNDTRASVTFEWHNASAVAALSSNAALAPPLLSYAYVLIAAAAGCGPVFFTLTPA